MAQRFDHSYLDASENAFLRRELEHVRAKSYDVLFPDEKGRLLVPVDHSVHPGAEMVTFNTMEGFGQSRVGGGYSDEGPRVDAKLTDQSQRIIPITNSYGYNVQEVRNSMMAGRSLPQIRANVARQVIEQDINQLLLLGNSVEGIAGLFNLSGATSHTVANGSLGTKLWADKTTREIVVDLHAIVNAIMVEVKEIGTQLPNTLVLPTTAWNYANQTEMGDGNSKTIMEQFLSTNPLIKDVEFSFELETASGASGRRMACYRKDSLILEAVIPLEFTSHAPQQRGFETIINNEARYGGIELRYPKTVAYGDDF